MRASIQTDSAEIARPVMLITGAARRVGRALALHFAARGWHIAGHYHSSAEDAATLVAEIQAMGGAVTLFQADLGQKAAAESLMQAVVEQLKPPKALINSAAIFEYDRIGAFDHGLFDRMMATNTRQAMALTEAAIQHAIGSLAIVHVLDQKIRNRSTQNLSYSLSKIALAFAGEAMARAAAEGKLSLRINALAPGLMLRSGRQTDADFAQEADQNPLGIAPSMAELCAAATLAIDSKTLNGQTFFVDGGLHLLGADKPPAIFV